MRCPAAPQAAARYPPLARPSLRSYYYDTGKYSDYNAALTAVATSSRAAGIPFRYMQLDSWWYWKGPLDGVLNWTAMPAELPQGLASLSESTNMRFVAHNRYWSNLTQYARQNGGAYAFELDADSGKAIPVETAFWVDLLTNATHWGLLTYEQDWLHNEFEDMAITLSDPTVGRQWLLQMGAGADAAGVSIQYCMPYPRHVLQSLEVPAVTQIRVSDDYHPDNDQFSYVHLLCLLVLPGPHMPPALRCRTGLASHPCSPTLSAWCRGRTPFGVATVPSLGTTGAPSQLKRQPPLKLPSVCSLLDPLGPATVQLA